MSLQSGRKFTAPKWTQLPIPPEIIKRVNFLGKDQPKDLVFYDRSGVAIEDEDDARLPVVARHALRYLVEQLRETRIKINQIDTKLVALASQIDECRRLMTIPGVGVVTATALVASMRDPQDFRSGRHFAAWLGLVPKQNSTGGVDKLGGISKRGDGYLRRLLIHGSRSVMRWRGRQWLWLARLRDRRPANVATVAVANKTARIVWALMRNGGTYASPTVLVA